MLNSQLFCALKNCREFLFLLGKCYFLEGVMNMKRKNEQVDKDQIAPGMDDDPELEQKATEEEIEQGDFTKVVTLSYDEVDPS